jgi:hypothetical protein
MQLGPLEGRRGLSCSVAGDVALVHQSFNLRSECHSSCTSGFCSGSLQVFAILTGCPSCRQFILQTSHMLLQLQFARCEVANHLHAVHFATIKPI